MTSIKAKNSVAERIAFSHLRKRGVYFQRHYKNAAGKPDIALPRKKKAVFIDGDFWHGRKYIETVRRLPKMYWRDKIKRNVERDKANRAALKESAWQILVVWESDILRKRTQQEQLDKIVEFLKG